MDGEPLDFPGLVPIIQRLRRERPALRIEMATNGIALDRGWFDALGNAGLDHLSISVNAPSREDYRWFTGIEGFDQLVEVTYQIPTWRQEKAGIPLVSANLLEIERWADRLPPAIRWLETCVDRVNMVHAQFVNDETLVNLNQQRNGQRNFVPQCSALHNVMTIRWDGEVSICPATEFSDRPQPSLGNVNQESIQGLWNSEPFRNLRRGNGEGKAVIEQCKTCRVNCQSPSLDALMKAAFREWG